MPVLAAGKMADHGCRHMSIPELHTEVHVEVSSLLFVFFTVCSIKKKTIIVEST